MLITTIMQKTTSIIVRRPAPRVRTNVARVITIARRWQHQAAKITSAQCDCATIAN